MIAVQCIQFGPPEELVVRDIPSPAPHGNQVLVEVKSIGVNFFDTLVLYGKYQAKTEFPFSPGGEIAGVVKDVGSDVSRFQPGDRIFAAPALGGFAQEVLVDERFAYKIPDRIDFETAATLLVNYGTSYHALFDRGHLEKDQTVLILGAAGGVGLAALQLAKATGARVIAAASTQSKLDFCLSHGADFVINYREEDLRTRVDEITNKQGLDVVYDPVGGDNAEPCLRSLSWGGRYLVVGFAAGAIPKIPLNLPLLKGCSIVGVFWGAFAQRFPQSDEDNFHTMFKMLEEGLLKPVVHQRFPLTKAASALNEILNRNVKGKILLDPTA